MRAILSPLPHSKVLELEVVRTESEETLGSGAKDQGLRDTEGGSREGEDKGTCKGFGLSDSVLTGPLP